MDVHKNARLTPAGREVLVRRVLEQGHTPMAVATAMGVCVRTVRKWVTRFQAEGVAGLRDRSSRPHHSPKQTPVPIAEQIAVLRRQRRTGNEIAATLAIARTTVFRILSRLGMNRLKSLEPAEPVRRYERAAPGDMIHIDIKKLGRFNKVGHRITGDRTGQSNSRGVGWEFVHVCIDDNSRVAFRASCLKPES
jgi:transposase-like protein